jgi:16S rRNA (adenine1518-N6/adenine1519-N6)-dimethyltransferase
MSLHQPDDGGTPRTTFAHKKSLGQNFLTSAIVPQWLCDAAALIPKETVLEIGPGTGALTRELLSRGMNVIAVEADVRAIAVLEAEFAEALASGQLTLRHADARTLKLRELGLRDHEFSVVANIPYYLSGLLLRKLLENDIQPRTLVFLLQKELVARIARDTKESLLSLSVKVFGDPTYIRTVSRGHFNPPPKVDSAILAVHAISRERLLGVPATFFFELLHLGLGNKRKQLIGNLSQVYERQLLENIFAREDLSLTCRGEDLPLTIWISLAKSLLTATS